MSAFDIAKADIALSTIMNGGKGLVESGTQYLDFVKGQSGGELVVTAVATALAAAAAGS